MDRVDYTTMVNILIRKMVLEMKIEKLITILQTAVQDKITVLEQRLSNNMAKLDNSKEDKLGMLEKMSLSSSIKNHQNKLEQYSALATYIDELKNISKTKSYQLTNELRDLFERVAGRLSKEEASYLQEEVQNIYQTKNAATVKDIKECLEKIEKQIKALGLGSSQIIIDDTGAISYFALTNQIACELSSKYTISPIVFSSAKKDGGTILMGDAYLIQKIESLGFEFLERVDEQDVASLSQIKKNVDLKSISEKTLKLINLLIKKMQEQDEIDFSEVIVRLQKSIAAHQKEIDRLDKVIDNYGFNAIIQKIDGLELI